MALFSEEMASSWPSSKWYDLSPTYSGVAEIVFENQNRTIAGTATFSVDPSSFDPIVFEAHTARASEELEQLLWNGAPGLVLPQGPVRPTSISIKCHEGKFTADFKIIYREGRAFFPFKDPSIATFSSLGGTYTTHELRPATSFVMPLYNFLFPEFSRSIYAKCASIESHPLRIYANKDTGTQQLDLFADSGRTNADRLIGFQIDEQIGFIEALPDYESKKDRLLRGASKREITSMLVCNAAARTCLSNDRSTWFPSSLLRLLSLASGQAVGSSWIEYRDQELGLIRRVHINFGLPNYENGHGLISEDLAPNTGYFLTQGMKQSSSYGDLTSLLSTHLQNAGKSPRSVEDRLISLVRAFEAIAKELGLASQNLNQGLSAEISDNVRKILDECQASLIHLSESQSNQDQRGRIHRISERVKTADRKDKRFGDSVVDVVRHYGLHDADVLISGFESKSVKKSWPGYLSFIRGAAIHEGGFSIESEVHNLLEISRVSDHLHDLLIRIFCKTNGLHMEYSSPLFPMPMLRSVDWVTANTKPSQLIADF